MSESGEGESDSITPARSGEAGDRRSSSPSDVESSVCVVTHPLSSAGENATRTLLEILSVLVPVSLVTADLPADSSIRDTREVIEVSSRGAGTNVVLAAGRFILNQIRMARALAGRHEEIVLFFGATSYLLPVVVAKLCRKTVVIEPRGDVPLTLRLNWERRFPTFIARTLALPVWLLERTCFRLADGVITYTPSMAEQLDLDPDNDTVYPSGARYVDTDRFEPTRDFEDRSNVVGFLGRLDEEKGVRDLAEVAQRLPDGVTFRFVGDGNLRTWLEDELAEEVAEGTVEFTGWVDHDEVPDQLNRLRLLVMPSEPTEGLPTTILESLACGTPVYATPVSGVPDVVREGETGFLMDEREPDVVVSNVVEILGREDLSDVATAGRRLIEAEYSFEAAVRRYRRVLALI